MNHKLMIALAMAGVCLGNAEAASAQSGGVSAEGRVGVTFPMGDLSDAGAEAARVRCRTDADAALVWGRAGVIGHQLSTSTGSGDRNLGFELGAGIDMPVAKRLFLVPHLAFVSHDGGGRGSATPNVDRAATAVAAAEAVVAMPPQPVAAIPIGTVLVFEVTETVSTSTHSGGELFSLQLVESVTGTGGASLQAGAMAAGVVSQAMRSTNSDQEAVLAVNIRSIQVDRATCHLDANVESATIDAGRADSGQRTAATIATGAAAGAVLGQILGGDTRSTVVGAAAGAAIGTGVALTTRDGHATLPAGSLVTARLNQPVNLP